MARVEKLGDIGLAAEASDVIRVLGELSAKHFDGDDAALRLVAGAKHRSIAPGAYLLQDYVAPAEDVSPVKDWHDSSERGSLRTDYTPDV